MLSFLWVHLFQNASYRALWISLAGTELICAVIMELFWLDNWLLTHVFVRDTCPQRHELKSLRLQQEEGWMSLLHVLTKMLSHRGQQCTLECYIERQGNSESERERDRRERHLHVLGPVDWSRWWFCWLIVNYTHLTSQSTH